MANPPHTLVILGGAKSVGGQCARKFTAAGWNCFIADDNAKTLDKLSDELNGRLASHHGNPSSKLGRRNILAGVIDAFDRVDAVIHIPELPEPSDLLCEDAEHCFEDDLLAAAREVTAVIRLFGRQMISQAPDEERPDTTPRNHSFTQVFAMSAITGDIGRYSQSASQSMALAAAKAAALDLSVHKIRSNAIVAVRPRAEVEESWLKKRTPTGRQSHAEEIADAAYFLAGDGGANMTAQSIIMDGGRTFLNGIAPLASDSV